MNYQHDDIGMKIIARIYTDFPSKFGIPRQSGITAALESKIVFEKEYRRAEALRGITGFSHLWLIWYFSENRRAEWSPTVRPPRLGGNKRVGVFATRSPFRPNALGLSSVKLSRIEVTPDEGTVIYVCGADMVNATPIFDIKPYIPYSDSHSNAIGGFADDVKEYKLEVNISPDMLLLFPAEKRESLILLLENDPRPSYQNDDKRAYGFPFCGMEVSFTVAGNVLTVRSIKPFSEQPD